MAFVANDVVMAGANIVQLSPVPPMFGLVESVGGGGTIVNYPNGVRTTYVAQDGLIKISSPTDTNLQFATTSRVRPVAGIPNVSQRGEGVAIIAFSFEIASGGTSPDFFVVQFDDGLYGVLPVSFVEIVSG